MTEDFFALLGEPRRPWLDPDRVRDTFHRLSRTEHPDQQASENADFARLNRAQATLREPKLRLRHLLELEYPEIGLSGPSNVPVALADLLMSVHGTLRETDALLTRRTGASTSLAKALLAREEHAAREKVESLLEQFDALHAGATAELQAFDALWMLDRPADAAAMLQEFYQRLSYFSRSTEQLRERLFQLAL